jgi:hypothetical protein
LPVHIAKRSFASKNGIGFIARAPHLARPWFVSFLSQEWTLDEVLLSFFCNLAASYRLAPVSCKVGDEIPKNTDTSPAPDQSTIHLAPFSDNNDKQLSIFRLSSVNYSAQTAANPPSPAV